jgi:hypothetical protein
MFFYEAECMAAFMHFEYFVGIVDISKILNFLMFAPI